MLNTLLILDKNLYSLTFFICLHMVDLIPNLKKKITLMQWEVVINDNSSVRIKDVVDINHFLEGMIN